MSRKTVVFFFAFTLLFAAVMLAREPIARAESGAFQSGGGWHPERSETESKDPSRPPTEMRSAESSPAASFGAKAPSVVYQAFRQGQTTGAGSNKAALVVRYDDGSVQTRCVQFPEEEIGGDELLDRSGLSVVFGFSLEVCSINGEGCGPDDCFCECPSFPDCEYWAYYHWKNGGWEYSQIGASGHIVRNGDLEGWSWGAGDFTQGVPPPAMTFDQICNPQTQASPTPTDTPQNSGVPLISAFTAQPTSVQPGSCSTLTWQVSNASTVMLDSVAVGTQGTQQVCPDETRTYTLIAASATGQQANQQVTVQVAGVSGAQSTGTPTATTTVGAAPSPTTAFAATPDVVRSGMPTPAYLTPFPQPILTQGPRVIPQPGSFPTPGAGFSPLATPQLLGGVPLAPTAQPASMEQFPQAPQGPLPTATRFQLARPPTETPRPRRILGDGRPTPTPILVARAGGAPGAGADEAEDRRNVPADRNGSRTLVAGRAFDDHLLPQYAGYLATVVVLLAMGWLVHRRRGAQPSAVAQPVREKDAARGERVGRAGTNGQRSG